MRVTGDEPRSPSGNGGTHTNSSTTTTNNNNNNNGSSSVSVSGVNSGSQYALCALGVGLVALGIVMIVWSVVPLDSALEGLDDVGDRKNKASSVAFILTGSGVAMLLLSVCLGMRNRRREQQRLLEIQSERREAMARQNMQTAEELQRFDVPSYEEAVSSGQYPVGLGSSLPSASQLPSYNDLIKVDGVDSVEFENEVPVAPSQPAPPPPPAAAAAAASASNRRPGKNSRKLLPIKIRRIKSEKLRVKNASNSQPAAGISIEPLTPPPQYDDELPPL